MAQQSKVPLELEEKIQSFAGDIYVQIEDKISAFISTYAQAAEITNEIVENHSTYQSLKTNLTQLKKDLDQK